MSLTLLSVAVQAHPNRKSLLVRLLPELERAWSLRVVWDPNPSHAVPSAWRTYVECIQTGTHTPGGTHHLIIQDDAVPCRDFIPGLQAAIAAHPSRVIVAFVSGGAPRNCRRITQALLAGYSWAELDAQEWCPTVAVIYPTEMLPELLDWIEYRRLPGAQRADDAIIGEFLAQTRYGALMTIPSLVQHPDDVPSLLGTKHWNGVAKERVACCWIGDCSVADIDWSRGP